VRKDMEGWSKEMDLTMFERGSVVEIWEYVYSLYVVAGFEDCANEGWCQSALRKAEDWLNEMVCV
jgi:hypothetical protein